MALADFAALRASRPHTSVLIGKANTSVTTTGRYTSRWLANPFGAAAAPTTAAACSSSTVGAPPGGHSGYISALATWIEKVNASSSARGGLIIYDRLSHQGGLSGTVNTEQTTNLPTAALPRYTNGVGVMALVEIHTTIGTTATTYSLNYTNQAGTSGRTSPLQTIGGTNDRAIGMSFFTPLQVGDTGIRSVEGLTLTASTGTAGAFGITLWKPLMCIPTVRSCSGPRLDVMRHLGAMFSAVEADACLATMFCPLAVGGDTFLYAGDIQLMRQV